MRRAIPVFALIGILAVFAGCKMLEVVTEVGTAVGVATGTLSTSQADSINKTTSAVGKVFDKLTPENEYYIGRSVGATILKSYKPCDNANVNLYLNVLGQTLAMASDRPETFGGYRFLMLDTDEINAFAAPGGLIFVSRGLIKCCKSEDALASVLAHEVGHVQLMHGLKAIKTSRLKDAAVTAALEAGKNLGGEQLAQLTTAFEGTLSDITSTLVNSGYSRSLEIEADAVAVTILKRVGYNPNGLKEMLSEMASRLKPDKGFGKTHPDPKDRIQAIESQLKDSGEVKSPASRQARFEKALASF
ncbi:MAG: peptidase M48 [Lentisphaerae bacterium RIFOXYA12_FULL_48_11]|nr:MAG: peptidase M48 [Lentisphaerae bacterium RIFOXYA12_FULL_48_11]